MQSHSGESGIIAAGGWREGEGEGVAGISAAALCRIQRKDSIGYSSDQCQTWWPIGYWNRWYQTLTIKTAECLRWVVAARMVSPWVTSRYFGFDRCKDNNTGMIVEAELLESVRQITPCQEAQLGLSIFILEYQLSISNRNIDCAYLACWETARKRCPFINGFTTSWNQRPGVSN